MPLITLFTNSGEPVIFARCEERNPWLKLRDILPPLSAQLNHDYIDPLPDRFKAPFHVSRFVAGSTDDGYHKKFAP